MSKLSGSKSPDACGGDILVDGLVDMTGIILIAGKAEGVGSYIAALLYFTASKPNQKFVLKRQASRTSQQKMFYRTLTTSHGPTRNRTIHRKHQILVRR
jgi:hypothetical protein